MEIEEGANALKKLSNTTTFMDQEAANALVGFGKNTMNFSGGRRTRKN